MVTLAEKSLKKKKKKHIKTQRDVDDKPFSAASMICSSVVTV